MGSVCGIKLPDGLMLADKLKNPIYTPSSKAAVGEHDTNISFSETEVLVGTKIARQITAPKLSPFKTNDNSCCNCKCIYAIYNPEYPTQLLCIEQLGLLFNFLTTNGFAIDTSLTTMMQASKVTFKKDFVCFIRRID